MKVRGAKYSGPSLTIANASGLVISPVRIGDHAIAMGDIIVSPPDVVADLLTRADFEAVDVDDADAEELSTDATAPTHDLPAPAGPEVT